MKHIVKQIRNYSYLVPALLTALCSSPSLAQDTCVAWGYTGSQGFSTGAVAGVNIAETSSGTPYVAYKDETSSGKARVKMYNGSSWVNVGSTTATSVEVANPAIAINSSGTPYVFYKISSSGKGAVIKYNGSSWVAVGSALSADEVFYHNITIASDGTPYVCFKDNDNSNKATVRKYNGSSWVTVGTAGFSAGVANNTQIALDASNTPYVSFKDMANGQKVTVMKYNGSSWVNIGSAGISTGQVIDPDIAIDGSGTPYICYSDATDADKVKVKKYNGSSWVAVGSSFGTSTELTSIRINNAGKVFVSYSSSASGGKATVMAYNGSSWVVAGTASFTAGDVGSLCMAIGSNGYPHIAYKDVAASDKISVMYLDTLSDITGMRIDGLGNGQLCLGEAVTLANANSGGTWSSSAPAVASIGSASGIMTGISTGSYAIITYAKGGCTVSQQLWVYDLPAPAIGSGSAPLDICTGYVSQIGNYWPYGTWTSSNANVSIELVDGVPGWPYVMITGVSAGTSVITYTQFSGCSITATTTVHLAPGAVTTPLNFCVNGAPVTIHNEVAGGTWELSSYEHGLNINPTTGVFTPGTEATLVNIRYYTTSTMFPGCEISVLATVNPLPHIYSISPICQADSAYILADSYFGTWASSNTSVATVSTGMYGDGTIAGVAGGTATLTYTALTGCKGTAVATVNPRPATITGTATFPSTGSTTLSCTTSGGTWSSSDASVANIGSTTGIITGYVLGTATITYMLPTGCYRTKVVTATAAKGVPANGFGNTTFTNVVLHPNPNNGMFTLSGTLNEPIDGTVNISITDVLGRTIHTAELSATDGLISKELHITAPCSGIYLLTLSHGTGHQLIRFTIE